MKDSFLSELKAFEGRSVGPPMKAPDAVNQAMIRHWVEAIGDENPVYTDEEAARAHGFPGVVAPATMLQAWVMRGFKASMDTAAHSSTQDALFALLDGSGFTSVVATNCDQRYNRPLVLGDRLEVSSSIESVSPEKHTALGDGHFVTTRLTFSDDTGETVATMRFRILRFRPRPQSVVSDTQPALRPSPAITEDNAFFFEGARRGVVLIQRCSSCGELRHPPLPSCPGCGSFDWDTVESCGRGTVFSFVVTHHPQVASFEYPLPIAVVELVEGVRVVGDVIGTDPAQVHIGMPVVAETVAVDGDLTLVMFRPERSPES